MGINKIIREVVDEFGWAMHFDSFIEATQKKKLKEEDFDWVDEVKPFNLSNCNWVIETTNGDEWAEVEQFMFDNGWRWGDAEDGQQIHSNYEENYHFFFPDDHAECDSEMFDAGNEDYFYNGRNEVLEQFQDSTFYKWSDIRSFHINESEFDWAEETPVPPIHVGGKLKTPNGNILTITKIDYKRKLTGVIQMVHWRVFHDGQWGDASDRYWDVEKRIEDGVWTPVSDTISESDFKWLDDHEVTYDVGELEVGKTYQFVPDLSPLDSPVVDEAPSWVYDYGKSKFYIIKQEPEKGYITFKPIGKANRMSYDGKYTRLPYQARVFIWGRFKEVENPVMEQRITESAFDWVDDIGVDPLHVGNYVRIDGSSTESDTDGVWEEGDYIILKITSVSDDEVCYFTHKTNIEGEGYTDIECTDYANAKKLIDTEYWRPYNEKTGLFESEFDWAEKVPTEEKIPHWSGKDDGTEPGNGGKTFMYTDENGKEHSIKVGGTAYKHRTRKHDGGYFGTDGEVDFYDSSITQDDNTRRDRWDKQ
jgi:hypothetical protein